MLQPVIDQKLKESSEGDEWVAKCMNVVAEAKEQLEKYEEAEALRIKALKVYLSCHRYIVNVNPNICVCGRCFKGRWDLLTIQQCRL